MRRSVAVVVLASGLLLAACAASDSGVSVQPAGAGAGGSDSSGPGGSDSSDPSDPSDPGASATTDPASRPEPTTTVPPGPPDQAAPVVGECRGPITQAVVEPPTDTRPPVPCDQPHGFETFFVGELPDDAWPGDGNEEAFGLVDEQCSPALASYLALPVDPVPLVPDRVSSYAFFVPTEDDWARGERWFRCDAYVQPVVVGEETAIAGTLAGVYATSLPAAYRFCETAERTTIGCDQPHLAEWMAIVELPEIEEFPEPTGNTVIVDRCATAVQQALGATGPRPDLNVGYGLPDPTLWDLDASYRQAVCVVAATDGRILTGTMAGIGDAGPLPGAPPAAAA
jgi:hypothetical protein